MGPAGKMRSGIKFFHDNNSQDGTKTTSCTSSSLSSIEDEKVGSINMRSNQGVSGKMNAWKYGGSDQVRKFSKELSVPSSDGIKRSPAGQIKKATALSSPLSSFRKGLGEGNVRSVELKKVKSEPCRDLDRPSSDALQLVAEAEKLSPREAIDEDIVSYSDDQAAVVESNLDLGKSPDGIERSGSDGDSKVVSVCQEMAITSTVGNVSAPSVKITSKDEDDDSDEEEEEEVEVIEVKELVLTNERPLSIPPIARKLYPLSAIDARFQAKSKPEHFHQTRTTQSKLQLLNDLIMWREASKSALVFGIGAYAAASSSHTWDFNMSFVSVLSYSGLVYLAVVFIFRSYISRETIDQTKQQDYSCVVGEEEALWVMKLVLPYINEFLLNLRALFSGDPITTIKLAVLLFILARYGGSITIWKMAKLGFIGAFTVPKACSVYSTQLTSFGMFWVKKIRDAWKSCCHKKAIGFVVFSVVWNMSSIVVRIWTLFILFVAFKCYQQSFVKELVEAQEETI